MKYLKLFDTESDYKSYRDGAVGGGGTLSPMYHFVMTMEMCIITIHHLMGMAMWIWDCHLAPYGQQ